MSCVNPTCRDGVVGVLVDLGIPVYCEDCGTALGIMSGLHESQLYGVFDDYLENVQPTQVGPMVTV